MASRRILVVGSGGREHALAWRLARDPDTEVLVAPGNPGIARTVRCLPIAELDSSSLIAACKAEGVDLVVVGPEAPLAAGLADALQRAGVKAFGPSAEASRLEASKWFAKQLMREAGVPTARAEAFDALDAARAALRRAAPPYVVKADGIAAGKGVRVTSDRDAAEDFLASCLERGSFGPGGRRVLIEEFLEGEEASVMAVTDGERFVLLPAARDYKRAREGDAGPNTGGMGAFAPLESVTPRHEDEIARRVVAPVLEAMARRGTPYRGLLYCGIMLGPEGPLVVEFNCRFGDPETQAVVPLLEGSFADLLDGAASGSLDRSSIRRGEGAAVSVAVVDRGYPERVEGGGRIEGVDRLAAEPGVLLFHAAAAPDEGVWRVRGGRALHVAAVGPDREAARHRVYRALERLGGEGWGFRSDIAAARERARAALGAS